MVQRNCEKCHYLVESVHARQFINVESEAKLTTYLCDFCWNDMKYDDTGEKVEKWIRKIQAQQG